MEYRDISQLKEWDKNPRTITEKDFERLKKQIIKLGQYKPLIITKDNVVIGGNMRLRAYRELGIKKVWVSVVDASTDEKKIEYALSDNDRVGTYNFDDLSNLIGNYPDVEWENYSADFRTISSLDELIKKYNDEEINIDEEDIKENANREKKFKNILITCPYCQKSFNFKV